jgi:hypothetical protein
MEVIGFHDLTGRLDFSDIPAQTPIRETIQKMTKKILSISQPESSINSDKWTIISMLITPIYYADVVEFNQIMQRAAKDFMLKNPVLTCYVQVDRIVFLLPRCFTASVYMNIVNYEHHINSYEPHLECTTVLTGLRIEHIDDIANVFKYYRLMTLADFVVSVVRGVYTKYKCNIKSIRELIILIHSNKKMLNIYKLVMNEVHLLKRMVGVDDIVGLKKDDKHGRIIDYPGHWYVNPLPNMPVGAVANESASHAVDESASHAVDEPASHAVDAACQVDVSMWQYNHSPEIYAQHLKKEAKHIKYIKIVTALVGVILFAKIRFYYIREPDYVLTLNENIGTSLVLFIAIVYAYFS